MDLNNTGYQQLSDLERAQIENEINTDLVAHFYRAARPGAIVTCFISLVVFSFCNLFVGDCL